MEIIRDMGPFVIPVTALLVAGIVAVVVIIVRHTERMAKIERGIDPDAPRR